MVLSDLKKGQEAIIKTIKATSKLKQRLHSFGVIPGEKLELKECSIARQTMEIEVDNTLIALRRTEADKIEVEKV
jgi:ferrous iron transport protein A